MLLVHLGDDQVTDALKLLHLVIELIRLSKLVADQLADQQPPQRSDDTNLIKKQYRHLALLLHLDKNKFPLAEAVIRLITKSFYDNKLSMCGKVNLVVSRSDGDRGQQKLTVRRISGNGEARDGEEEVASSNFWTVCPWPIWRWRESNNPFGWKGEKGKEMGVFSINGEKGEEMSNFSLCNSNQTLSGEKVSPAIKICKLRRRSFLRRRSPITGDELATLATSEQCRRSPHVRLPFLPQGIAPHPARFRNGVLRENGFSPSPSLSRLMALPNLGESQIPHPPLSSLSESHVPNEL
ncbi:hypothetical protein RHMOL_Rhmol12G0130800 [Rhododendron molle]|uniref:Uncharacterized protein n=1 Tax=Rhododendron molle TaxID=49168 RepID=A0ACC0LI34_RHOML|nr:hypothetical protein RHMOL_Rhmol12G0130800 [Rhododendron molle]